MARATAQRIQELLHAGLSQSDIARRYGVTRQHIHNVLKRSGYVPESTGQTKLIIDAIASETGRSRNELIGKFLEFAISHCQIEE